MPSVISGDANVSATEFGFLDGVTSALQSQIDSKLPLAGGKILQVVRATDSTDRSTTSTSYVDVTGMSVTITPQKSDSAILVFASFLWVSSNATNNNMNAYYTITDSSNNSLSGAEMTTALGINGFTRAAPASAGSLLVLWGYSTPATTSATTYKLRFKTENSSNTIYAFNSDTTGQMYAIEVSA